MTDTIDKVASTNSPTKQATRYLANCTFIVMAWHQRLLEIKINHSESRFKKKVIVQLRLIYSSFVRLFLPLTPQNSNAVSIWMMWRCSRLLLRYGSK